MRMITSLAGGMENLERRFNAWEAGMPGAGPPAPNGRLPPVAQAQPAPGRGMLYTWDIRGNRITDLDHATPHQLAAARPYAAAPAPAQAAQPLRLDHGLGDGNAAGVPDLSGLFASNLLFWIEAHPYACIDLSLLLPEKMAQAQVLLMAAQYQPGPMFADQAGPEQNIAGPGAEMRSATARRAAALFERAGLDPSLRAKVDASGDATAGGFASLDASGVLSHQQYMCAMMRYTTALRKAVQPPELAEGLAARLVNHCTATMGLTGTHSIEIWNGYDRAVRSTWGALGAALAPNHNQGGRDEQVLQSVVRLQHQPLGSNGQSGNRGRLSARPATPPQRKRGPTADRAVAPEKESKTARSSTGKREHHCRQWNSTAGCSYGPAKCKFVHKCSKCGKDDHIAPLCEE